MATNDGGCHHPFLFFSVIRHTACHLAAMAGTGQEFFEATTEVAVENMVLVLEEAARCNSDGDTNGGDVRGSHGSSGGGVEGYVPYVNLPDAGGARALHHAAIEGHTALASVLLQHRADPRAKDGRGRTAIDYATSLNKLETLEVLEAAVAAADADSSTYK